MCTIGTVVFAIHPSCGTMQPWLGCRSGAPAPTSFSFPTRASRTTDAVQPGSKYTKAGGLPGRPDGPMDTMVRRQARGLSPADESPEGENARGNLVYPLPSAEAARGNVLSTDSHSRELRPPPARPLRRRLTARR